MTPLGSEVKRLRERRRLTLAQMAELSHLGMNFVWDVESGRDVECCSWQIERLAKVLGVPPGALFSLVPPNRRKIRWTGRAA